MEVPMPSDEILEELLGKNLYDVWKSLASAIDARWEMEHIWSSGGRNWSYEYKWRRGSRTLCSLFAGKGCLGFMIVFGKDERLKVDEIRGTLSESVCRQYDEAETYHDGKWVMFRPADESEFGDYIRLLSLKRKPNRKETGNE